MSVARRLAAAFAVVGAGVLAYAVPAAATGDDGYEACIANPTAADFEGRLDPKAGKAVVWAKDGHHVCGEVLLSIYRVPEEWDGNGFNPTAVPQALLATDRVTVKGTRKKYLEVPVPDCGNLQIDLYVPPEINPVTEAGHGVQLIKGFIWSTVKDGEPVKCEEEPTPTPTPTTPVPTPTETTPVPTPTETTPVPTATPTEGLGAPIPVEPPQAPPAPPVLAETGSDSTVPLLGLGILLIGAGIGLSLVGRRRTT